MTKPFVVLAGNRREAMWFLKENGLHPIHAIIVCDSTHKDRMRGLDGVVVHRTGTWQYRLDDETKQMADLVQRGRV